jgi:hypothetical protein
MEAWVRRGEAMIGETSARGAEGLLVCWNGPRETGAIMAMPCRLLMTASLLRVCYMREQQQRRERSGGMGAVSCCVSISGFK